MADLYGGARFMPQSFFIDRDGTITKTSLGLTDEHDLEEGLKTLLPNPEYDHSALICGALAHQNRLAETGERWSGAVEFNRMRPHDPS